MDNSRSEAKNIQNEPETTYCQKPASYEFLLGQVVSKRLLLAKDRKIRAPIRITTKMD